MNDLTPLPPSNDVSEVSPDTPGIAVSKADLEIAKLTQSVKWNLSALIWKSAVIDSEGNKFSNPDIVSKAIEIQEKYRFQPLGNRTDFSYLSRVISIEDFAKRPELYFTKLTNGIGSFPLDFDFEYLADNFLSGARVQLSNGILSFQHQVIFSAGSNDRYFNYNDLWFALNKALIDVGCAAISTDAYIKMDIFTFLKNYDAFQEFVEAEVDEESRENVLASFRAIKVVATSMLKAITNIRIQTPHSFFAANRASFAEIKAASSNKDFSVDRDNPFKAHDAQEEALFLDMEKILLDTAKWVSKTDVDQLLKIQNPEQFVILVDLLVQKILLDPKMKKTWISNLAKDIGEYDTEELIAFSTFLARYLIEEYQNLDTMTERVMSGFSPSSLSGKCTDYAGMSIHILNNYFKLKYPEKFQNITIGYDAHNIGDRYKHCYMKIYGYGRDGGVDVTFIDPTKLAGISMRQMKLSKDVFDAMDASNLPIQIDRNAEDLIVAKLREGAPEPGKLGQTSVIFLAHTFVDGFKTWALGMIWEFRKVFSSLFRRG